MSRSKGRKAAGTSVTGKRLQTIGLFVTLLVVAVLVGSLAAGLVRGRGAGPARPSDAHGAAETKTGAVTQPLGRVRVEVLNASGVPGLAAKGRTQLRDAGFDVVYVGNAPRDFGPDSSVVLDRVGRMEMARSVADQMAIPRVYPRPDSNVFVDVTVVLGKDWVESEEEAAAPEAEQ